jgi:hypothetical protein
VSEIADFNNCFRADPHSEVTIKTDSRQRLKELRIFRAKVPSLRTWSSSFRIARRARGSSGDGTAPTSSIAGPALARSLCSDRKAETGARFAENEADTGAWLKEGPGVRVRIYSEGLASFFVATLEKGSAVTHLSDT